MIKITPEKSLTFTYWKTLGGNYIITSINCITEDGSFNINDIINFQHNLDYFFLRN